MDEGLLLLRCILAAILFMHACQKALGWFQGKGPAVMAEVFEGLGLRPGRPMVLMASTTEILAAFSLGLGLLVPLGALAAAGTMLVAGLTMHLGAGTFWNAAGGGEYPYLLALAAVVLAMTGPGRYALDSWVGSVLPWYAGSAHGPVTGLVVALIAVVAAVPFARIILRHRRAPA